LGKIDGVKNIQTNVEAKTVVVEADESVSPEFMLEKLQKVRRCCHDTYTTRLV
jgi:copper chaperone CopZ